MFFKKLILQFNDFSNMVLKINEEKEGVTLDLIELNTQEGFVKYRDTEKNVTIMPFSSILNVIYNEEYILKE